MNKYGDGQGRDESALNALRASAQGTVDAVGSRHKAGENTAGRALMAVGMVLIIVGVFWLGVAIRNDEWTKYVAGMLLVSSIPCFAIGIRRSRRAHAAEVAFARQIDEEQRRSRGD